MICRSGGRGVRKMMVMMISTDSPASRGFMNALGPISKIRKQPMKIGMNAAHSTSHVVNAPCGMTIGASAGNNRAPIRIRRNPMVRLYDRWACTLVNQ